MNNALCVTTPRRTRRRPEQIQQLLSAYEASGLTQTQFAQQSGIGYSTLSNWLRRRRRHAENVPAAAWWPVEVKREPHRGGAYQVHWATGVNVQIPCGFDPAEVRTLLELLSVCSR